MSWDKHAAPCCRSRAPYRAVYARIYLLIKGAEGHDKAARFGRCLKIVVIAGTAESFHALPEIKSRASFDKLQTADKLVVTADTSGGPPADRPTPLPGGATQVIGKKPGFWRFEFPPPRHIGEIVAATENEDSPPPLPPASVFPFPELLLREAK